MKRKLMVAIPVLDELDYLAKTLNCIQKQHGFKVEIFICVNQPEAWWDEPQNATKCENNAKTIDYLKSLSLENIHILDKSSKGNGWDSKEHGVGWARKTLMDRINSIANEHDILVSLDADTTFEEGYFSSIITVFDKHPEALALSNPYYHNLTEDDHANRAILRYEIYMRNYAINLLMIGSPYAFTALGSAIAFPIHSYRIINGIAPKKSGEDFYFLQRLRKTGALAVWNESSVYPAARFSDRVFFGTGPAMIKGNNGNWDSYPIYHHSLFDKISQTYQCFDQLYTDDIPTPLDDFFGEVFGEVEFWKPLRKNYKTKKNFIQACHNKFDGLRILQYLKSRQIDNQQTSLQDNLVYFGLAENGASNFDLETANIEELNNIRNLLHQKEQALQQSIVLI